MRCFNSCAWAHPPSYSPVTRHLPEVARPEGSYPSQASGISLVVWTSESDLPCSQTVSTTTLGMLWSYVYPGEQQARPKGRNRGYGKTLTSTDIVRRTAITPSTEGKSLVKVRTAKSPNMATKKRRGMGKTRPSECTRVK